MMTANRFKTAIVVVLLGGGIGLLSGCPFDVLRVKHIPTQLHGTQTAKPDWVLENEAEIDVTTGYHTTLKAGTHWEHVGTIDHGDIYKTTDQIVTVEGSNIFEAYLVMSQAQLVGFYLPVEGSYSPIDPPMTLDISVINSQ